jgi:hypothetical protein
MAGKEAFRVDSDLIGISSVRSCLKEYGQSRLADLYKEHRHQCPQMELLVEAFPGSVSQYSTTELLVKTQRYIIVKYGPPIDRRRSREVFGNRALPVPNRISERARR